MTYSPYEVPDGSRMPLTLATVGSHLLAASPVVGANPFGYGLKIFPTPFVSTYPASTVLAASWVSVSPDPKTRVARVSAPKGLLTETAAMVVLSAGPVIRSSLRACGANWRFARTTRSDH